MIIGVDAGALSISDVRLKVGVYRVTLNLLKQLSKIDQANTYRLYSFGSIDSKITDELGSNMKNVFLPSFFWSTFWLPLELMLHPVDVFLGISQMVPVCRGKKIGFIHDMGFLHNPSAYPNSYHRLKYQTDSLIERTDRIITFSKATAREILHSNIQVIYEGVDSIFTAQGKKHLTSHPYFLFVGALKRGKNIPGLLRGFGTFLKAQKKPIDLYLVGGDYWKDPNIDKEIESLGLSSRVRKLGFVPDTELASYYRGALVFVSPSLYEGFCLPAVEAMACGCPVIGSTSGAMPEIVGDAGILVDPLDTEALSEAMNVMTENTVKRNQYRVKGLRRSKQFSWARMAKRIYELLHT